MKKENLIRNQKKSLEGKTKKSRINWKLLWIIIPVIVICFLFTWFYQSKNIVMSVGPLNITRVELEIEKQRLSPPDYQTKLKSLDEEDKITTEERLGAKALENLIKLKCIYLYAQENNITASREEVDAKIEEYSKSYAQSQNIDSVDIKATLADYGVSWRTFWEDMKYQTIYDKVVAPIKENAKATDEELREHYNEFAEYYDEPAKAHVYMIVVEEEAEATSVMDQLIKENADFAKLAQEKSISPTVMSDKGDNGWIVESEMYEELGKNIFHPDLAMKSYYMIKARDGYYIFRVDERSEEKKNTFEDVYESIEQDVLYQKQDQTVNGFMTRLSDQYESQMIVGNKWTRFLKWWDHVRGVTK
ncbi:MAG: peptidyl-prolyl cis-trans isomerase [Caldisericia bacterium]|nr:peptidyl-prolyl cis-trans isomerase [Caldisericia bacterium]